MRQTKLPVHKSEPNKGKLEGGKFGGGWQPKSFMVRDSRLNRSSASGHWKTNLWTGPIKQPHSLKHCQQPSNRPTYNPINNQVSGLKVAALNLKDFSNGPTYLQ